MKTNKPHIAYRLFKLYVNLFVNKVYYSKKYNEGVSNIPPQGQATIIVSNHQSGLDDALGVIFLFDINQKPHVMTRGDAFGINPILSKIFYGIGILPAYRLAVEGEESLGKNQATFSKVEEALLAGNKVALYPETKTQERHSLNAFSLAYTKIAFDTAQKTDFKQDIVILPTCNYYSNRSGYRNKGLVKVGEGVHIKDYYELYQTKPRTAQRMVNEIVRSRIKEMMLHIDNDENYESIDFIRRNFREYYAKEKKMPISTLPEQLLVEKALINKLTEAKDSPNAKALFKTAIKLKEALYSSGLWCNSFTKKTKFITILLQSLLVLITLPIYLFSLWPGLLQYLVPVAIFNKVKGNLIGRMVNTFIIALNVLILIPILYLTTFFVVGGVYSWLCALGYVILLPFITIFAGDYSLFVKRIIRNWKYIFASKQTKNKISSLVKLVKEQLNNLI